MVKLQNEYYGNLDFGIASFSINPEYDTPEILKEYAKNHGATLKNWNFLTGDKTTIYNLANKGIALYAGENSEAEGGFEHSGNFALIDKNGFIRSREVNGNPIIFYNGMISEEEKTDDEGMPQEISILKQDIAKLLKE